MVMPGDTATFQVKLLNPIAMTMKAFGLLSARAAKPLARGW